ncbi:unnamed protein product [Trifolium pratense]|uniref:Uncharacterized protein n=1 Tax=Trifolium pratense TaxID=57577 RepID=A0ACB0L7K3_TRIPR|nr:unnamed protein product [Trifolium pratense]
MNYPILSVAALWRTIAERSEALPQRNSISGGYRGRKSRGGIASSRALHGSTGRGKGKSEKEGKKENLMEFVSSCYENELRRC